LAFLKIEIIPDMEDAIYLRQVDGNLVEMTVQSYESEPLLQELLTKYPLYSEAFIEHLEWALVEIRSSGPNF
jgi:hypothetical protein